MEKCKPAEISQSGRSYLDRVAQRVETKMTPPATIPTIERAAWQIVLDSVVSIDVNSGRDPVEPDFARLGSRCLSHAWNPRTLTCDNCGMTDLEWLVDQGGWRR